MSESDTTVVSKDKNGATTEVQDTKVSEKDSSADIKVGRLLTYFGSPTRCGYMVCCMIILLQVCFVI